MLSVLTLHKVILTVTQQTTMTEEGNDCVLSDAEANTTSSDLSAGLLDFMFLFNPAFYKFLLPIEKCCSVVPRIHDSHDPFKAARSCNHPQMVIKHLR